MLLLYVSAESKSSDVSAVILWLDLCVCSTNQSWKCLCTFFFKYLSSQPVKEASADAGSLSLPAVIMSAKRAGGWNSSCSGLVNSLASWWFCSENVSDTGEEEVPIMFLALLTLCSSCYFWSINSFLENRLFKLLKSLCQFTLFSCTPLSFWRTLCVLL